MNRKPSLRQIKTAICKSLRKVFRNDAAVIRIGQERAIAHLLACELSRHITKWDVDVEYNRVGGGVDRKRNIHGRVKIPDVIIHSRLTELNIAWIEIKVNNNEVDADVKTLTEFTSNASDGCQGIVYNYGISISLLPIAQVIIVRNGKVLEKFNVTKSAQQGGADGARDLLLPGAFRSRIRGGMG